MEQKTCLECNAHLLGRIDKIFCNTSCRSAYHNRKNIHSKELIREVDSQLKLNWKILNQAIKLSSKKVMYKCKELISKGFDPSVFTGFDDRNEMRFYKVYNYEFILLEDEIQIVYVNQTTII